MVHVFHVVSYNNSMLCNVVGYIDYYSLAITPLHSMSSLYFPCIVCTILQIFRYSILAFCRTANCPTKLILTTLLKNQEFCLDFYTKTELASPLKTHMLIANIFITVNYTQELDGHHCHLENTRIPVS